MTLIKRTLIYASRRTTKTFSPFAPSFPIVATAPSNGITAAADSAAAPYWPRASQVATLTTSKGSPNTGTKPAYPAWSAYWDLLDVRHPAELQGDAPLKRLWSAIQSAIFDEWVLALGRHVRRRSPNQPLRRLEGQAGLQAVAAMVVILREAHEAGHRLRAFKIGRSLHLTLLMAVVATRLSGVALEVFEFFIRHIFPIAADNKIALDPNFQVLRAQAHRLGQVVLQLEDADWSGNRPGGPTCELRKVLSVNYGFDLLFGLSPRMKLIVTRDQASEDTRRGVASNNVGWEWGRRYSMQVDDSA